MQGQIYFLKKYLPMFVSFSGQEKMLLKIRGIPSLKLVVEGGLGLLLISSPAGWGQRLTTGLILMQSLTSQDFGVRMEVNVKEGLLI